MRHLVIIFILYFCTSFFAQGLPGSWSGAYQGTMELFGKEVTPFSSVLVRLEILEIKKDSVWTYYMTFGEKDKLGYLEKKYLIELHKLVN